MVALKCFRTSLSNVFITTSPLRQKLLPSMETEVITDFVGDLQEWFAAGLRC